MLVKGEEKFPKIESKDKRVGKTLPSDNGYGLRDRETHAFGHVEKEENVGNNSHGELDRID